MYNAAYMNWGVDIHTIEELTESIMNIAREIFIEILNTVLGKYADKFND